MRAGMQVIGQQALEGLLAGVGRGYRHPAPACDSCGQRLRLVRYQPRRLRTLLGPVQVQRAYYRCAACGQSAVPLDAQLGLERHSVSRGLQQAVCRLGAHLPFATAQQVLAEVLQVVLDDNTVQAVGDMVDAPSDHTAPSLPEEGLDGLMQSGPIGPHVVEGDPSIGIDQVRGVRQPSVYLVHGPRDIVHQHRPDDAFVLLVPVPVLQLLIKGLVRLYTRTWVGLPDEDVHKVDLIPPVLMQFRKRLDRAVGDRSGIGAEMEKHGRALEVAQAYHTTADLG